MTIMCLEKKKHDVMDVLLLRNIYFPQSVEKHV